MKTFTIYPDKARALGNVMNNNSNVEDMEAVNANVMAKLGTAVQDSEGNSYSPPETVEYNNLKFPTFKMCVLGSLYETSLALALSNTAYVGDNVSIQATLRDNNNELLDGSISFKCGNDYISNGTNNGGNAVYVNTSNGVASINYAFDSMGEYVISADSVATNRHHTAHDAKTITVSKKSTAIMISASNTLWQSASELGSRVTASSEIQFGVRLYNNNQTIAGLPYTITLDGESFDNGVSTANGETFTLTDLDRGPHTLTVDYQGNNMYESCTQNITIYNGKIIPDVTVTGEKITLQPGYGYIITVTVSHDSAPIEGLSGAIDFGSLYPDGFVTNENGQQRVGWVFENGTHTLVITTDSTEDYEATTTTHTFTVP